MEWIKGKALKFMDEISGQLFDDLLAEDDGHLRKKMIAFLDEESSEARDVTGRLFFLYKTYYEKILQEDLRASKPGKVRETSRSIMIAFDIFVALDYS
jgi:hypothetical protein